MKNSQSRCLFFLIFCVFCLSAVLRLWQLDVKPAHFDEGVNGWFADRITETGFYKYDPENYHGPLHMYAVFVSQTLGGRNIWALRMPAIVAGLLVVWGVFRFRRFFGDGVGLLAALGVAISPAYVFFSRYSIHESLMVFFVLVAAHALMGFWQSGSRRDLCWLVVGVAGMVLTKETYVIHCGVFLLATGVFVLWQRVLDSQPRIEMSKQQYSARDFCQMSLWGGIVVFLFYSGFFLNMSGVCGIWETYEPWFRTGMAASGHEKADCSILGTPLNYYWLALMARYEPFAMLGFVACFYYVFTGHAQIRWLAIVGAGTLLAFSLIPYKTPWCIISIIWAFQISAAKFAVDVYEYVSVFFGRQCCAKLCNAEKSARLSFALPCIVGLFLLPIFGWSAYCMGTLNWRDFSDEVHPYVYVQTFPEIKILTAPLLDKARQDPTFYHARGAIYLDSYYPLPWILGDFTHIGYFDPDNIPEEIHAEFVVCPKAKAALVEAALVNSDNYIRHDFRLRASQDECSVFFRFFID